MINARTEYARAYWTRDGVELVVEGDQVSTDYEETLKYTTQGGLDCAAYDFVVSRSTTAWVPVLEEDMSQWLREARLRWAYSSPGDWSTQSPTFPETDNDSKVVSEWDKEIAGTLTPWDAEFIASAKQDLPVALEVLASVLAIHRRVDGGLVSPYCQPCQSYNDGQWPCATVAAIQETLEGYTEDPTL